MDTSGLQSKIQQLQDEHPIIRLNRWFATHLQNELNGFLVNCMKEIVSAFEEEWDFALSDEGDRPHDGNGCQGRGQWCSVWFTV